MRRRFGWACLAIGVCLQLVSPPDAVVAQGDYYERYGSKWDIRDRYWDCDAMNVSGRFADGTEVEVIWFPHFRSEAEIYSGPEERFYEGGSTRTSLGFFCWPRDNQRMLYRFVCGVDGPIDAEWFQPSLVDGGRWHEHDQDAREALLKLRQDDVEMKDYYWKYVEEEEFRHWFVPTTAREACITGISSEP